MSQLKVYIGRCPNEDFEQNVLRVVTIAATIVYLYFQGVFNNPLNAYFTITYFSALVIVSISVLIFASLLIFPRFHVSRRLIGMVLDISFCTYAMIGSEEQGAPLFFVYYWVCVGNGVRWGVGYLYSATLLSLSGFCLVLLFTEYWIDHKNLAVGILFGLVIIPVFVAHLLKRLNKAIVAEKRANEAKSIFLANVSHEMRTPLNGIKGYIELIQKEKLSNKVRDYLEPVILSVNNLHSEINNILDISKIEAGEMATTSEPVYIKNTIESEVAILRPLAERKRLKLIVTFSDCLPIVVSTDESAIRKITRNLIENSLKFTSLGKVSLNVNATLISGMNYLIRFVVEDTGIGIPPDVMEEIFIPFKQADSGVNRKYEGTGLGLSITKNLVTQLGGGISISSKYNQCTAVTVEIPMVALDDDEAVATDLTTGEIRIDASGAKVLVVDDNDINRNLLKAILETQNFNVDTADSGNLALKMLENCNQDVYRMIFVDIHMPGMDGIETINSMKNISALELPPIVAVTADVFGLKSGNFGSADFDSILIKPIEEFSLRELSARYFPEYISTPSVSVQSLPEDEMHTNILDRDRGLELASGSEELWRRSVNRFLELLLEQIEVMQDAITAQNLAQVSEVAHHIKGSAQYIGANSLCRCVERLEELAVQGSESGCSSQLELLKDEYRKLRSTFDSLIG
ncbi:ATP-binding protein [Pseudomonadota bacterium]